MNHSMTDYFVLLGQPRRPWLDPVCLKDAFHRLSLIHHPDAAGGNTLSFSLLNSAFASLQLPASRLKHLLNLQNFTSDRPANEIPPSLSAIFLKLAALRQHLAEFLGRKGAATSALGLALLATEHARWVAEWMEMKGFIEVCSAQATGRLQSLDAAWLSIAPGAGGEIHEQLELLQKEFVYLARWSAQIRESLLALEL